MLTRRQAEICTLVARGLSDKQIARKTGLSVKTVEAHVRDAGRRIPCDGRPRYKCMVWFFSLRDENDAA